MPTATTARRMFELLEPICLVTYFIIGELGGPRRRPTSTALWWPSGPLVGLGQLLARFAGADLDQRLLIS